MGHEFGGSKELMVEDLSFGWFPGRALEDIPGAIQGNRLAGIGASEADGFIWHNGKLRKPFQHEVITSSALAGDPTSLFWWADGGTLLGSAGTRYYSSLEAAAPTNITGAWVVIQARTSWTSWRFEDVKYAILTDQTNLPKKFDGTTLTALGPPFGVAPKGKWIATYQDAIWLANCTTTTHSIAASDQAGTVYFSALGDPDTWDNNQAYTFNAPITGLAVLDKLLVVFKQDSIGILYGNNNFQLIKINNYVSGIGATSGYSVRNIKLEGKDAVLFHSNRGWAAFTGTKEVVMLSTPIEVKYQGNESTEKFNGDKFDSVITTWWGDHSWAVSAIADGGSTNNNLLLVKDCRRVFPLPGLGTETGVAHWPFFLGATQDTLDITCMETYQINGRDAIAFGQASTDKIYKLEEHPTAFNYVPYLTTKILDLGSYFMCNEANILSDPIGGGVMNLYINMNLDTGRGEVGTGSLESSADLLDSTFVLDSSVLGGNQYAYNNVQVTGFGRWLQLTIQQSPSINPTDQATLYGAHLTLTPIGNDPTAVDAEA